VLFFQGHNIIIRLDSFELLSFNLIGVLASKARKQESKKARKQESKKARKQESKKARKQESKKQESKKARKQESKKVLSGVLGPAWRLVPTWLACELLGQAGGRGGSSLGRRVGRFPGPTGGLA